MADEPHDDDALQCGRCSAFSDGPTQWAEYVEIAPDPGSGVEAQRLPIGTCCFRCYHFWEGHLSQLMTWDGFVALYKADEKFNSEIAAAIDKPGECAPLKPSIVSYGRENKFAITIGGPFIRTKEAYKSVVGFFA
jgi:hypothetical protein